MWVVFKKFSMKKFSIIVSIVVACFFVVTTLYLGLKNPGNVKNIHAGDCFEQGGVWLPEFNECENVGKAWCKQSGGAFFECESACRNDPDAEACTLQCVPVCQYQNSTDRSKATSPKDATYTIVGMKVELTDGVSEIPVAPESATMNKTSIIGEPVMGDLDGDGESDDAALILLNEPGGSGAFYYAAAAIHEGSFYRGTHAIFLGDRIAPQTIEIKNEVVIANFTERKPGEAMTERPTVAKSVYAVLYNGDLSEIQVEGVGEQVLFGEVTARVEEDYVPITFKTCDGNAYSILPNSLAYEAVKTAYGPYLISSIAPNVPMPVVLSGTISVADSNEEVFEQGQFLSVTNLLVVPKKGVCVDAS